MEAWRKAWREGIVPVLTTEQLQALLTGLLADDNRLLQCQTVKPTHAFLAADRPAQGACVIGYCGWQGDGLETVSAVDDFFANTCSKVNQRLGDSDAVRYFLNWYDGTPRDNMLRELAAEVRLALAARQPQP